MEKGTHGMNEESFEELDYASQAKTLNAQILGIERGLIAHMRKGENEGKKTKEAKEKYILQLRRIIENLK